MAETFPKILVAYFSVSGNTKAAAQAIAHALGADLEQIETAKPLPSSLVALLVTGGFAATMKRPWAAKASSRPLSDYDLIIIGMPIWAWHLTPVIRGWLGANPIPTTKPYAAFVTSGASPGISAFSEIIDVTGRRPIATMTIRDADRKSGSDQTLIDRFAGEIHASFQPEQT